VKTKNKIAYTFLKILTGSDLSRRRLPMMSAQGETVGPVVWLTSCIHGDEVSGVVIIQEIFRILKKRPMLKGAVKALPLMNPIGFEAGSRNITLSKEDLNRSFPGNRNGSLAERIAETIFSTIEATSPALVLDLHCDWIRSMPYTLIDQSPGPAGKDAYAKIKQVAKSAGLLIVQESVPQKGTFSYSLIERNIAALTLELGESYVVNEENVRLGVRSVMSILTSLEMLEPQGEPFQYELPAQFRGKTLRLADQPTSSTSGVIRFLAGAGDVVTKGKAVARIYNTFGKLQETIVSPADGIVLGHCDSSVGYPGAPVMAIAVI
jgi:predicted deacylase